MKNKLTLWMMAILVAVIFAGCSSDSKGPGPGPGPDPEPGAGTGVQNWIVDELKTLYLWNDDVKAKAIDYKKTDYKAFFNSLLSTNREDGKLHGTDKAYFYSAISDVTGASSSPMRAGTTIVSLGASYYLHVIFWNTEKGALMAVSATVREIAEDSPLWKAGMRRGDHILATNGIQPGRKDGQWTLINEFLEPLSSNKGSVKIDFFRPTDNGKFFYEETDKIFYADFEVLEANAAPANVEFSPVHRTNVVTTTGGKKVGYIAYREFDRGVDGYYDSKLKDAIRDIKSKGATEMVLDLRYNGGGYMTSCQLLTSMLMPGSRVGENIMRLSYNETLIKEDAEKYNQWLKVLSKEEMKEADFGSAEGDFLGISRLYVIISDQTASASEALIHAVKGIGIPVYTIGLNTEGKNVGMTQRLSERATVGKYDFAGKKYEAWPITLYIKDAKDAKYSNAGFAPDYVFDELNIVNSRTVVAMKELGDPKEELFATALHHIDNGSFPVGVAPMSSSVPNKMNATLEGYKVNNPTKVEGIMIGAGDYLVE